MWVSPCRPSGLQKAARPKLHQLHIAAAVLFPQRSGAPATHECDVLTQNRDLVVMHMPTGFWRRLGSFIIEPPSKNNRQLVMDANLIVHVPKLIIWWVATCILCHLSGVISQEVGGLQH